MHHGHIHSDARQHRFERENAVLHLASCNAMKPSVTFDEASAPIETELYTQPRLSRLMLRHCRAVVSDAALGEPRASCRTCNHNDQLLVLFLFTRFQSQLAAALFFFYSGPL